MQQKIGDLLNQKGVALKVIEAMRTEAPMRRSMLENVARGQKGEKNENVEFLEKYALALLGQSVLADIIGGWNDEAEYQSHPDKEM